MRRTLVLILSAAPFLAMSILAPSSISDKTAEAVAPTMVAVNVAVAIFAVNFSFVAFQLAPYRQLVPGPSWRHVAGAALLVLASLAPLLGAASGAQAIGRIGVGTVPVLSFGALLLVSLALWEASPARIVATRASERALRRFAKRFGAEVAGQTAGVKHLSTIEIEPTDEPSVGPPMHELGHRLPPPPIDDDPLEVCVATANAAVSRDDAVVFVPAVERLLQLSLELRRSVFVAREGVEGWEIRGAAAVHAKAALQRVESAVVDNETRDVLVDRFMEALARAVREAAVTGDPGDESVIDLFYLAASSCCRQIRRKTSGSGTIGVLIAARQAAEKGTRELDDSMKEYALAAYASGVQRIGEAALDARDSETLYRCLETLSWIGCSAVRHGAAETGRRAAGALVQLGRRARHESLECHWDRCALTPFQHAEERLTWIATWVPHANRPDSWLESLGTAFSRLDGCQQRLELDESDPMKVRLVRSGEPYTESYFAPGGQRTVGAG